MTSIEWLMKKMAEQGSIMYDDWLQAKEMHKQEIKDAWCDGAYSDRNEISEQYYQETFVSKGSSNYDIADDALNM